MEIRSVPGRFSRLPHTALPYTLGETSHSEDRMTGREIQELRHSLGENAETFAARFARSRRTVEDWEQGRRNPDPLALKLLVELKNVQGKRPRSQARRSRS
jgi:DNA-binding transcriptional regulator YiaG